MGIFFTVFQTAAETVLVSKEMFSTYLLKLLLPLVVLALNS